MKFPSLITKKVHEYKKVMDVDYYHKDRDTERGLVPSLTCKHCRHRNFHWKGLFQYLLFFTRKLRLRWVRYPTFRCVNPKVLKIWCPSRTSGPCSITLTAGCNYGRFWEGQTVNDGKRG
jgi:hypothetical protein